MAMTQAKIGRLMKNRDMVGLLNLNLNRTRITPDLIGF